VSCYEEDALVGATGSKLSFPPFVGGQVAFLNDVHGCADCPTTRKSNKASLL